MTDEMQGLKHVSPSPLTRRLLESAKTDASTPGAMQRALSGVGLASSAVVAAKVAAAGTQSGASALGTGTAAAVAAKAGLATVMVWVGVGFAGTVALVGGAAMLSGNAQRQVSAPATSAAVASAAAASSPVAEVALPAASAPLTSARPANASTPAAPGVVVESQLQAGETVPEITLPSARVFEAPATVSSSSLVQVAELSAIRKAIAAKQPAVALTQLDRFARQYPASPLAEEARVLRIEALHALGRTGAAAALAKDFLASHPTSVYEARVRAAIP